MAVSTGIGARVRTARKARGLTLQQLADQAGMALDALSRAERDQRGFAPFELAAISRALHQDLYELTTGRRDPLAIRLAARHHWDATSGAYLAPRSSVDEAVHTRVARMYRVAFPDGPPASAHLPTASELRATLRLSEQGTRKLVARVEESLGIDVISVPKLATAYVLTVGPRSVILLPTTENWFFSNWSIAHELGHLAAREGTDPTTKAAESAANAYAAELLMPSDDVAALTRTSDPADVARFAWHHGVSTQAIRNRMKFLGLPLPPALEGALSLPTQRVLRTHLAAEIELRTASDRLARRGQSSAQRRFPPLLLSTLEDKVAAGSADPDLLAWALDIPLDDLDFPEAGIGPEAEEAASHVYLRQVRPAPDELPWHVPVLREGR